MQRKLSGFCKGSRSRGFDESLHCDGKVRATLWRGENRDGGDGSHRPE